MNKRNYKKAIMGGKFKWYTNVSDLTNIAKTGTCLGLTRGASVNLGDAELRMIEADGQLGMVKLGARITDVQPSIQINLLQFEKDIIRGLGRFLVDEDKSGEVKIRPKGTLEEMDYLLNLVGVGETQDGEYIQIVLENPVLNTLPSLELSDKDEVPLPLTFFGTYESADSKEVPIYIIMKDSFTNEEAGKIAYDAINTKTVSVSAASDITDEATLRTKVDAELKTLIDAAVDTANHPNALIETTLLDGDTATIEDVLASASGDTNVLKVQIETTGFDGTEQPNIRVAEITIDTTV